MMLQCCGTSNTGCCPLHHQNIVSFDNLKRKYRVNEDIHIEYTLHGSLQHASTRDWLGIFPRGWSNLQQYLTFEYALVAPRAAASSNRTIVFPRVFHQEASINTEYQLVYVSREIQVLATSSYFRFIRDGKTDSDQNHVLHFPYRVQASSFEKREINSDQIVNSGWTPAHMVLSDQSLLSLHPSRTIPANPRLPRTCKSCGRPRDSTCGLAAGRARFLSTHNASLTERVVRLERDLALAEGAKSSFAERLRAYENFVAEMLRSLAAKRVVKITDASGKEIVLQQLPIIGADPEAKITDSLNSFSNELWQEGSSHPETNDLTKKEELFTNDRALVGEYLSEGKTLPIRNNEENVIQTQGKLDDDCKSESLVENKRVSVDVETQTQIIDAKCIGNISETQNYENTIEVAGCSDENKKQAIAKENEILETSLNDLDEQKDVVQKRGCNNGDTEKSNVVMDDGSKNLQSKPSAIVIQGSNVKFAIISDSGIKLN